MSGRADSNEECFCGCHGGDEIFTWGCSSGGGDSSDIQSHLFNVQFVAATNFAFAAVLGDGSVVTRGHPGCGGDSSAVKRELRHVEQIDPPAILEDIHRHVGPSGRWWG